MWEIIKDSNSILHVVPEKDLIEHNTNLNKKDYPCPCNPVWKDGVLVHDAMDGREWNHNGK